MDILKITPENYKVPKGEERSYHCIIECKQFNEKTGERISTPRIQKFGKKMFETHVLSSLKKQGYDVIILHDPKKWIAEQQAKQAELAAQKAQQEAEQKAKEAAEKEAAEKEAFQKAVAEEVARQMAAIQAKTPANEEQPAGQEQEKKKGGRPKKQ